MNTLDDLRSSLQSHADRVAGVDSPTRSAQVAGRVRAVRRRRATGAVVAAVAVVAAAGGVALLPVDRAAGPAGPDETPGQLVGHDVPETIEAAGWTYEYAGSVTGQDVVAFELDGSDEPQLIAWGNESPDGRDAWKVNQPDDVTYQPSAADFTQYYRTSPGVKGRFRFSGPGDNALAVYELSDERPAGVTVEGLTFRERVAGDQLVAADAVRGESTLSMRVEIPEGTLRFAALCSGTDEAVRLDMMIDGDPVNRTTCVAGPLFDPGSLRAASWPAGLEVSGRKLVPGDQADVELRLVGDDGQPVEAGPEALVAASFYEMPPVRSKVAGQPVPELVEVEGVTWRLDRMQEGDVGAQSVVADSVREPSIGYVYMTGFEKPATVLITVDDGVTSEASFPGPGATAGTFFLPAGSRLGAQVRGAGAEGGHTIGMAFYVRAD